MKTYITNEFIGFGSPNHYYAWIRLDTGLLTRGPKTSDEDFREAGWLSKEWVIGQVLLCPDGVERTLGRGKATPESGCFEATLAAPGNPDYQQYASIAPAGRARGMTTDEVAKSCREYIENFDLGGGNWGRRSGVVSQYVNGKKKKVGYVRYNGRYETVAERKAFEKKLEEKYGCSRAGGAAQPIE